MPSRNTPAKKAQPRARRAPAAVSPTQPANPPLTDDDRKWLAEQASIGATTHQVQALAEGVDLIDNGDFVKFMGEEFRMSDRIGLMPLMHLAIASKRGVQAADMEGLAAMYELLRDCIDQTRPQEERDDPENPGEKMMVDIGISEWDRFEEHAVQMKAEADDFQQVVTDAITALTARPSPRPGDSSAGPQAIQGNLRASSPQTGTRPSVSADGSVSVETLLGR